MEGQGEDGSDDSKGRALIFFALLFLSLPRLFLI